MGLTYTVRVGSTDPLIFALKEIDPTTEVERAFNVDSGGLAGTVVTIRMRSQKGGVDRSFVTTDVPAKLTITDAPDSEVTFYPDANEYDEAHGRYYVNFWVELGGKNIPVPNGVNVDLEIIT